MFNQEFTSGAPDVKGENPSFPDLVELLTYQDVARLLRVSERHIFTLVKRGALRCVRVGSAVRFHPDAVKSFIAGGGEGGAE